MLWLYIMSIISEGAHSGVVVKTLCYKPAGRGFDSRWCQDFSPWHNPVGRTMALGSTQSLTEMSTRCVSCHQERWPVRKADNLPPLQCRCQEIWASGPAWPVMGVLYFCYLRTELNSSRKYPWTFSKSLRTTIFLKENNFFFLCYSYILL